MEAVVSGLPLPTPVSALSVALQHPPHDSDEPALVARVRAGDVDAYGQLYRSYFQRLCEFATFYVASLEDANDIVSDVFMIVWEHRAMWAPLSVETYLFGAVRNRALNRVRDARAQHRRTLRLQNTADSLPGLGESSFAPDADIEASSERSWRLQALREAITHLSEQQRTVLTLRWRFQKGWPEIAQILEISVTAAQMTHSRALNTLRGWMDKTP